MQAYQSCCVCTSTWSKGIGPRAKCLYDGYRRFLKPGSRGRHRRVRFGGHVYQYRRVETRPIPRFRDDDFVRTTVMFAKRKRQPVVGHKSVPLLANWPGYSWYRMNTPDLMHGKTCVPCYVRVALTLTRHLPVCLTDSKLVLEMLTKLMVGYVYDAGSYSSWSKDAKHRSEAQVCGIFRDIWPDRAGPLPWRLTKEEREFLDKRMLGVIWPHYLDRVAYRGFSFWKKPNRLWKTRRKIMLLYYILPTQLRDQVPQLRVAINEFVWAMRRLEGQVHSYHTATSVLGILPGSRTVRKSELQKLHNDLVRALCLFEGCIPPSHLKPALHHFTHYAEYTKSHGSLRLFWMMVFERCVCARVCHTASYQHH